MTQWRVKKPEETYNEEEIKARLEAELPHWYYEDGWIRRKYKTAGWKGTLMVVKLMNHAAKGVTNKDFELAKKIEEVILWQPGKEEGSALEGTPDDPRFKYIKYD